MITSGVCGELFPWAGPLMRPATVNVFLFYGTQPDRS